MSSTFPNDVRLLSYLVHNTSDNAAYYVSLLSRGGLTSVCDELQEHVTQRFAYLDASSAMICNSSDSAKRTGQKIVNILPCRLRVFSDTSHLQNSSRVDKIIFNVFFKIKGSKSQILSSMID